MLKEYVEQVDKALRARLEKDPDVQIGAILDITIQGKTLKHRVTDADFVRIGHNRENPTFSQAIQYCEDLGMHAFPRAIISCEHATSFCSEKCYNKKHYLAYGQSMNPHDEICEEVWHTNTPAQMKTALRGAKRFRLATRGEIIANVNDVKRLDAILDECKETVFWLPTRSWRHPGLKKEVESLRRKHGNLRVLASIDPTTTQKEYRELVNSGWSTMFFGDDDNSPQINPIRCSKTWEHKKGVCKTCDNGCFESSRKDVWLKQH